MKKCIISLNFFRECNQESNLVTKIPLSFFSSIAFSNSKRRKINQKKSKNNQNQRLERTQLENKAKNSIKIYKRKEQDSVIRWSLCDRKTRRKSGREITRVS